MVCQVVLLPPQSSEAAAAAAARALTLLISPIPGQRGIGSTQLLYLLHPDAAWQTVSPGFGGTLLSSQTGRSAYHSSIIDQRQG